MGHGQDSWRMGESRGEEFTEGMADKSSFRDRRRENPLPLRRGYATIANIGFVLSDDEERDGGMREIDADD